MNLNELEQVTSELIKQNEAFMQMLARELAADCVESCKENNIPLDALDSEYSLFMDYVQLKLATRLSVYFIVEKMRYELPSPTDPN